MKYSEMNPQQIRDEVARVMELEFQSNPGRSDEEMLVEEMLERQRQLDEKKAKQRKKRLSKRLLSVSSKLLDLLLSSQENGLRKTGVVALPESPDNLNTGVTHLRISGNQEMVCLILPTPPQHLTRERIANLPKGALTPSEQSLIDGSLSPELVEASKKRMAEESGRQTKRLMNLLGLEE